MRIELEQAHQRIRDLLDQLLETDAELYNANSRLEETQNTLNLLHSMLLLLTGQPVQFDSVQRALTAVILLVMLGF